ncbi:pulmonary surfactant-associated protein A-like isoform X1 [Cloeon dipterum]|uniref:pulmonary surfactant-associated protein A-like isoform X1 n=1 Tax=Cloeon dipterum TaxID=197152 RepID=UPI0032204C3B
MRWAIHILVLATIPWLTLCQQEQEEDDVCTMGMMLLQGISRKLRGSNLVPTEHTKEEIINDVDSIKSSLRTVNDQLSKMNRNLECLKGNTLKWIRLESGKKYYYSDFYKYTWYDAKEFCENSGGVLASTHNEDELKTIYKANPIASSKPWVFVSATDIGQNPGNFYWADGSILDRNSSMWLEDNDPDAYGVGKETCVYMTDGKLADATCINYAYFVCEARLDCL